MSPDELTAREQEVLNYLLEADFPGRDALREQAKAIRVLERIGPTVVFEAAPSAPKAEVLHAVPVEAHVKGELPWEVLLFVKDGYLDSIELVTYDVGEATELPPPADLDRPFRRRAARHKDRAG